MDISDRLQCVFSAQVVERDGSFVLEIPKREITHGHLECGAVYRTAMLATASADSPPVSDTEDLDPSTETDDEEASATISPCEPSGPPVQTGEVREVEIETLGDQGDGIARVERGYVIIVPETQRGDRVTIEITTVRENVAFGAVVDCEAQ